MRIFTSFIIVLLILGLVAGCRQTTKEISVGSMTVSIPTEWQKTGEVEEVIEDIISSLDPVTEQYSQLDGYDVSESEDLILILWVMEWSKVFESQGIAWEGFDSALEADGMTKEDLLTSFIEGGFINQFIGKDTEEMTLKQSLQYIIRGCDAFEAQVAFQIEDEPALGILLMVFTENDLGIVLMLGEKSACEENEDTWEKIRDSVQFKEEKVVATEEKVLRQDEEGIQPAEGKKFEVVAMIEINEYANAIAADDSAVCVACFGLGRVILIDPKINKTTLASPYVGAFSVTVGDGIAWFTNIDADYMTKVDWEKEEVETIFVGQYAGPITYGEDSVWVVVGSEVLRIDSQNNEITEVIEADIGYIIDIVVDEGVMWLIEKSTGSVYGIDTLSKQFVSDQIKVGEVPIGGACGEGSLWVTNSEDGTVSRISQNTNQVTNTIKVGNSPTSITVGKGLVWIANSEDNTVSVIDPRLNETIKEINIDGLIIDIAFGDGSVWILYRAEDNVGKVLRINP